MQDHYRFYVVMKTELIDMYIIALTLKSENQCTLYTISFRICIGKRQKKCTLSAIQTKAIDNKPEIDSQFFHIDF